MSNISDKKTDGTGKLGLGLMATASAVIIAAIGAGMVASPAQSQAPSSGIAAFDAQVEAGRQVYAQRCAACHGPDLTGGQFATTLTGPAFLAKWGDVPAQQLLSYIKTSMPPGGGGTLADADYDALTALILAENDGRSDHPIANNSAEMGALMLPQAPSIEEQNSLGIGGRSQLVPFPQWPGAVDRFANYTPVTQEMLSNPAPENWLSWRRGHEGHGYSPLDQINKDNISSLRIAWAQALPTGETFVEPLVRDGVLYIYGYGDQIFAFDAATGVQIWRYQRQLPEGTVPASKKTMALHNDKLILGTSDFNLIALDARTGLPVWDVSISDFRPADLRSNGGPLVADGVAMIGVSTSMAGGGLIAGFDADTGEALWRFDTVAKSGTLGGDTWNDLPDDERRGGSVWTSGTYDAESGLALWGVAQSYDTGPIRDRKEGANNDALFTNSTLAFQPRTGELVWYYQHMANDQYDLDWVFERVIADLEIDGEERRVVITGGKEGLFDTLDLETGQYISTADMGFQDFIIDIDPVTGRKTPDPALLPGRDKGVVFMCPHAGGGRNWSPSAFDEDSGMLFINARDTCMEMRPSETGFLTSGVDIYYSVPADSDGKYGFLQGIDMSTGEVKWEHRRRAPYDVGMLATSSGLLFSGAMDRQIMAYDQETGAEVWSSGLPGIPNGSPISYSVDGTQYVAFVTGSGNPLSFGLPGFTPEIPLPELNNSALYVYALPKEK